MRRRVSIAVLLSLLVIAAGTLTGCDSGDSTPAPGGGEADLTVKTVILTVGGDEVYWPEFLYWLRFIAGYYKQQNGLEAITDWTAQANGRPLKEFLLSSAVDYAGRHHALQAKAAEMGIALSEADKQEMAKSRAENVAVYGSESEYQRIVRRTYVTEDVLDYLLTIGYLSDEVFTALYGAKSEKCTDAQVSAYIADKGLMCARYILLSSTGSGGAQLSDTEKAGDRALLESLIEQLRASGDPVALIAELVLQYNEDPDAVGYTDGVLFTAAQMPPEFVTAYDALADNQSSGVVETGRGLYLIMKTPIGPDMIADQAGNTLRYRAAYESLFQKQVNDWYAAMKLEFTDAYDSIDLEKLFGPAEGSTATTGAR